MGLPLDREGITTPGPISCSLILARIPKDANQYVAYTTRTQTSPITGVSAVQATGENTGTWTKVADGEYTYTFRAKAPAGFDGTVTHTVGIYGSRNLTEFDMGTNYDDDAYNFVPGGGAAAVTRDVIKTATCNKCHFDLAFHGGSRKTMDTCVLCHTPQTVDPDTGNTVDMPVMTHKIHMGANLPSVKGGKPYIIIGNRQSVHDYSHIQFTADPRSCTTCHEQNTGAAQAANVYKAERAACGACHDDINFATGEGHQGIAQTNDKNCAFCHPGKSGGEFDNSVEGAHVIPRFSKQLPGVNLKILEVQYTKPGEKPLVIFSIKNDAGVGYKASEMTRLTLILAGPNTDYSYYVSESALKADGSGDGTHWWSFQTPIPADAKGSWTVALEARKDVKLVGGREDGTTVRDTGINQQYYFSVDSTEMQPRRAVASMDKCNACHKALAFHGEIRNTIGECVICHAPTRTDRANPARSIDMGVLIHKIHRGRELERGYNIGTHVYDEVGFPGDLRVCTTCHVSTSTYQLPLASTSLPVTNPWDYISPAGRATANCLACHDSKSAAAHASTNTSPTLGEACASCHGPNAEYSVDRLHAR
jgi:OmcA/MtrC family decaheme c-type cytochrome